MIATFGVEQRRTVWALLPPKGRAVWSEDLLERRDRPGRAQADSVAVVAPAGVVVIFA